MKLYPCWRGLVCVLGFVGGLSAAEPVAPELRGVLTTGDDRRFALAIPGGDTAWVGVGGKFSGWTLSEYRAAEDAIVLTKDGRRSIIKLSSSKIAESDEKATLADAEDLLAKMKFEEMFEKLIAQQKKTVIDMTKTMTGGIKGANAEDVAAFQAKVMDTMFAEMNPEAMKADFTKIYSEVFTKAELKGVSDFYGTSAGQALIDKQPEVQKKTMEIMMPRMMAGMAKIGPLSAQFAKEQAAKKAAAKTEAAGGASTSNSAASTGADTR